jgi:hypothetical protein
MNRSLLFTQIVTGVYMAMLVLYRSSFYHQSYDDIWHIGLLNAESVLIYGWKTEMQFVHRYGEGYRVFSENEFNTIVDAFWMK